MSKWKIRLENTMFMHPDEDDFCYGPRWCITSPTGVNWGNKATFAEAIAYADEKARTRTYVLPHGTSVPGEWEYAVQYLTPGGWKYSRKPWEIRWQESEAVQEVRAHRDHPGQETRIVRRLVSQPEVMEP
ncbi:hypothetical protein ACL1CO_07390 [Corynebacterium striatum]